MMNKIALGALAAWLAGACTEPSADGDERTVTITAVHLHADGSQDVQESVITQHELAALVASKQRSDKEQLSLAQDFGCAGQSLWLYDASNNMLCFSGAGWADLYSYPHGSGKWADQVRSFWPGGGPGAEAGYLYNRIGSDFPDYVNFSAGQPRTDDVFGSHHDTVVLSN